MQAQLSLYDAFMKLPIEVIMKRRGFRVLFVLLCSAAGALAQPDSQQGKTDAGVAVARCAYTQADDSCTTTVAQMPRRMPGLRPAIGPPPPRYSGMWMSPGSPGHALIGALIGFGLGAAIAAKGHAGAGGVVGLGTLGAGIGAAIGFSAPAFPARPRYRGRWPDNDDEEASAGKPAPSRESASQPAPAQSVAKAENPRPTIAAP